MGLKGNLVYRLVTTADHKLIGIMYVVTCSRTELAALGLQFLSNEQFNQFVTRHGTIMFAVLCHPDRVRVR